MEEEFGGGLKLELEQLIWSLLPSVSRVLCVTFTYFLGHSKIIRTLFSVYLGLTLQQRAFFILEIIRHRGRDV